MDNFWPVDVWTHCDFMGNGSPPPKGRIQTMQFGGKCVQGVLEPRNKGVVKGVYELEDVFSHGVKLQTVVADTEQAAGVLHRIGGLR